MTDVIHFYKNKRILITGGAGAIGHKLALGLYAIGAKIIILDNFSSGFNTAKSRNIRLYRGSILNRKLLEKILKQRIDIVFHLAANFANQNSVDHPYKDLTVNGEGTLLLLDFARRYGVKKFIFNSSSCVYSNGDTLLKEQKSSLRLDTPYAIHKLLGEMYCDYFTHYYGFNTLKLRIFNVFGPGEKPGKYRNVIPNFLRLGLLKKSLPITGTGNEIREFNYVDETAKKIAYLGAHNTKAADVYNISGGTILTIKKLAKTVNTLVGNPAGITFFPRRKWDVTTKRVADITKLRKSGYFKNKSVNKLFKQGVKSNDFESQLKETASFIKKAIKR